MNLRLLYLLVLLFLSSNVLADGFDPAAYCAAGQRKVALKKTTLSDTAENNYDIKYLKFNLNLNNTSTSINGNVTTYAQVTASSFSTYVFELNNVLTIDSLKINGTLASVSTTGNVRKVTLTSTLSSGSFFTAQVFYHGISPIGTGFFTQGLNTAVLSSGTHIMYSCSDPNWALDWWPCKQSITDKIDSVDMWVTIPDSTKMGSNGLLQSVTTVAPGFVQYKWKTKYPIDYYLISVAVAPYVDFSSYMHFTGSTDSMLIQQYFYDTASFLPLYKKNFDSTGLMVDYFSTLYGRYPFYKEKYGHCFTDLGGGMEHQTMTTMGETQTVLIAHELCHQWFGDCVTYASWKDIWLSEGFASYNEQLYLEHFWSVAAAHNYRTTRYNAVMGFPDGSVYLNDTDTTNVGRIFDTRLTYYKGAAVAHMLRFVAPADTLFFKGLQEYQKKYAFKTATTDSLKNVMEAVYGIPLDTFFNQWVYGQGYPTYAATWNQVGNTVYVQLVQTTSMPSSVGCFSTPLEIELKSSVADTVVKVYSNQNRQLYSFTWDRTMGNLTIDPNNWILNKTGTITHDPTLNIPELTNADIIKIYPNPSGDNWQLILKTTGVPLTLTDVNGRMVWHGKSELNVTTIPGKHLAAGNYFLKLETATGSKTMKLVHW